MGVVLNIGCGPTPHPDAINLDIRPGGDLQADVHQLPFGDGCCDELRAFDILEHFPHNHTAALLAEWRRVLRPGGRLLVQVPNMHALAVQIVYWGDKPGLQLSDLIQNVYGGHRWGPDGCFDTHHWGWTPYSLSQTLDSAGFTVEDNDLSLNMRVQAIRE